MNAQFTKSNLPAVVAPEFGSSEPGTTGLSPRASEAYAAHLIGQSGQRRGLKGGQPVLDTARAAYLEAEWRGAGDRRLPPGTFRRVSL